MSSDFCKRVPSPYLVLVSGIAAAYWATGRLALLLAIPPGYATAIWPPAGIAFAAILLYGARVWPGIVLGSFLVNVWTAFDTTTVVSLLTSIALPTSIGMGTALQALVGVGLVRRVVGFPTALDQGRHVAAFLVLGGPVSCLIGATWGVTSLLAGGIIPWPTGLRALVDLVDWGYDRHPRGDPAAAGVDGRTAPGLAPPPVHRGAATRGRVRARGHLFCACAGRGTGPHAARL